MSDDKRLILSKAQFRKDAIRHALHLLTINHITRVKAEREMIHRLIDAYVLRGRRSHDLGRELRIICREVSRCTPRNSLWLGLRCFAADNEISTERLETAAATRNPNHDCAWSGVG